MSETGSSALYRLASQIRGACDLHVVTLRYPERRGDYTVGGIPVHALGRTAAGIAGLAGEWHAAAAVLGRLRPDVIHGYWVLNSGLIAACFAGRRSRYPERCRVPGAPATR